MGTHDELVSGERRCDHDLHHVGRDRKADAMRAARAREDRSIDPDEAPVDVDERAARVARIDRGIGLDEELKVGNADARARGRRNDALRHGLADAERIAHGKHEIADLDLVGVGNLDRGKAFLRPLDAQHREIRARISQNDFGFEFAPVAERDADFVRALNDVMVGDDEAGFVHDHARTERALHALHRHALRRRPAEEPPEELVVHERIVRALLGTFQRIDVDDRGRGFFHRCGKTQRDLAAAHRHALRERGVRVCQHKRKKNKREKPDHRHHLTFARGACAHPARNAENHVAYIPHARCRYVLSRNLGKTVTCGF